MSILLYGCTTWTLTKRMEKNLDGNFSRMLQEICNKSWRQHPTKQQLYGHQPSITKIIKIRRTRHAGHCWRSRDEHISDVLLWTLSHGRTKAGRPARTYIQKLCTDAGCSLEDLPEAMDDWEGGVSRWGISMLLVRHDDDDLFSRFQCCQVFVGEGVFIWVNFSFMITFRNFILKKHLETESI